MATVQEDLAQQTSLPEEPDDPDDDAADDDAAAADDDDDERLARPPGSGNPMMPPAQPASVVPVLTRRQGTGRADVTEQRLFTRPFVALLSMQAAYGFSFSMFFLLPKYLATLGESASNIGFVMGGFGVACILTIPFLSGIVALLGRRGALMAATLLLATAGTLFALLPAPRLMAIALRALEGVTWTIMFSTAVALTAEMAPPGRMAQAIGLAGAASLVMNAVAPAIGEPLADRFGYRPAFLLASGAAVIAALLARRLPANDFARSVPQTSAAPPAPRAPTPEATSSTGGRGTPAAAPPLRIAIYAVFGVSGLAFSVLFTFLGPFAISRGGHAIREFFIAYTIAALVVRILGGRVADRVGHRTIAGAALLLYGLVVASTGLLAPRHLWLLGLAFGSAHGAVFPALMALLIQSVPSSRRPRLLGIANGAMSIGISSVFPAGLLVARVGYPGMFALAGGLVAMSSALLLRARSDSGDTGRRSSPHLPVG